MSSQIVAHCNSCADSHQLGDRRRRLSTDEAATCCGTACPVCDSPRYATEYTGEYTSKSDAERIADIARPAGGVGTTNLGNLLATFDHYVEFDVATATELMAIDGIGRKTAENIVNRRDGVTA